MNKLKKSKQDKKVLTNNEIYDILHVYISEQIELSIRKQRSEENFSLPSWAEYQAYQLGFLAALDKLKAFVPEPTREKDE